jgi:hypothetical protein
MVDIRTFEPIADTVIFFDGLTGPATTSASNAQGEKLSVGQDAGAAGVRRSLLRFDLSTIAPGSVIEGVELKLFETKSRENYDVSLHRVLQAWGEGTSNGGSAGAPGTATAGDATWLNAVLPGIAWNTPGGDFESVASATTNVGFEGAFYAWSSAQMVADVQSWVDAPSSNHGWILIGVENVIKNPKLFGSAESAVSPILTVQVTPVPEPAAYLMLALGLGVVAVGIRRRDRHG